MLIADDVVENGTLEPFQKGTTFGIICIVSGPNQQSIKWMKDGQSIKTGYTIENILANGSFSFGRSSVVNSTVSWNMTYNNAKLFEGQYTCHIGYTSESQYISVTCEFNIDFF